MTQKNEVATRSYDPNGNLKRMTDRLGNTTQYGYDPLNRLEKITNALGFTKGFNYTPRGNLLETIDENRNTTTYAYNPLGRFTTVNDALGHQTGYDYDPVGNLAAIHQYRTILPETYAALGADASLYNQSVLGSVYGDKQYSVNGFVYGQTETAINNMSSITEAVDTVHQPTYYHYDKRNLVNKVQDALGNITNYTHDANGNLTKVTDRDGYDTRYAYDPANRLINIKYDNSKEVNFSYNPMGQMTSMSDWLGNNAFEVDPLGRVTKITDFLDRVTKYSYTATGQRAGMVYPDGSAVTYGYNLLDQLTGVTDAFQKTTAYNYDPAGNVIERILPNGSKTVTNYDPAGQIKKLKQLDPGGKYTDVYEFAYDPAGNKTKTVKQHLEDDPDDPEESEALSFTYDALNQLKTVTKENGSQREYLYDSLGNRLALTETESQNPGSPQTIFYRYN